METVSKKRGRPPAFDPRWVAQLANIYPDLKSQRQIKAKCYEITAVAALTTDGAAIPDITNVFDPIVNTYRARILEHLGRLKVEGAVSDDDGRTAARWLSSKLGADRSFTVRKAVALLQLLREEVQGRLILGCTVHPADKLLQLLSEDQA